jgi:hypothetical protein
VSTIRFEANLIDRLVNEWREVDPRPEPRPKITEARDATGALSIEVVWAEFARVHDDIRRSEIVTEAYAEYAGREGIMRLVSAAGSTP